MVMVEELEVVLSSELLWITDSESDVMGDTDGGDIDELLFAFAERFSL